MTCFTVTGCPAGCGCGDCDTACVRRGTCGPLCCGGATQRAKLAYLAARSEFQIRNSSW